MLGYNLAINLS